MANYLQRILHKTKSNTLIRKDLGSFLEFGVGYALMMIFNLLVVRGENAHLSKGEMGRFSFISSLIMLLLPIVTFSAQLAYIRFHNNHTVSGRLRRFLMPFFWGASLGLVILIYCMTRSYWAILFAFMPLFIEKTFLLRCQLCITRLNILQIAGQLVVLAGVLYGSRYIDFNANTVLGLYGVGYLLALIFPARKLTDDAVDKCDVIRYLWPSVLSALCSAFLVNCAVMITKYYFNDVQVGAMGVAVRLTLSFNYIFGFFMMFYPLIYMREAAKNNFKLIIVYRRLILLVALVIFAGMILCSKYIYLILGAGKYLETIMLFVILAGVVLFNFIGDITCLYFDYQIKTWKNMLMKLSSCFIVLAGAWAVPRFGIYYIALLLLAATAIPALTGMYIALYQERRHRKKIGNL